MFLKLTETAMTDESGFHATATLVPTSFRELGDLLIVTIKTLGYLNEEKKQNIKVHSYYWLQKKKTFNKKNEFEISGEQNL